MSDLVNNFFKELKGNQTVFIFVTLFVSCYGGMAATPAPNWLKELFENWIFKLLVLFLIAFSAHQDAPTAIMLAVLFYIVLDATRRKEDQERYEQLENYINYN
tara:strand:- start:3613 stop:3921 length:309 start_codon:yes stop_codon:yes gene_type:complete